MSNFYPVESLAKGKVSVENLPFVKVKNPSQARVQMSGQNLESFDIKDGDFLVFDFNAEIKKHSFVMLWQDADYHCFFVESIAKNKIQISNDRAEISVKPNEILGRVIRMERDL